MASSPPRASDTTPILFLDYDGVLHPAQVFRWRNGGIKLAPEAEAAGRKLFDRAEALADVLSTLSVQVVLATSWVPTLGFDRAKSYLPAALQTKVIGATFHTQAHDRWLWAQTPRWNQIQHYVQRHTLANWFAIDDDADGWPLPHRKKLVHTDANLGLTAAQIEEVVRRLRIAHP